MKTKQLPLVLLLVSIFTIQTNAQDVQYSTFGNILVAESSLLIDGFETPAYSIYFEDEIPEMEKVWKNYLKDNYDIRLRNIRGLLKAENVRMYEVSNKEVTLYSKFEAKRPLPQFVVTVALSRDTFIQKETHPIEAKNIKAMMIKFVKSHQLDVVNEELADVQKSYDKINSSYGKIAKEKASVQKDKLKNEGQIVDLKSDIEKNKQKIQELEARINSELAEVDKETKAIELLDGEINNLQKNLDVTSETLKMQKEKVDMIKAKKDLILSQSTLPK